MVLLTCSNLFERITPSASFKLAPLRFSFALFLVLVAGCTTTAKINDISTLQSSSGGPPRVLLMPMDIELYLLTTGGLLEPKVDWTEQANQHFMSALKSRSASMGFALVEYDTTAHTATSDLEQLKKLHQAVGQTMMEQRVLPMPTKIEEFKWSLGNGASSLSDYYESNYALFVHVRDSYASAGRQALIVASAIASAFVPVPVATGGTQVAYASLVDLETGDIVWFNNLVRTSGDLREEDRAYQSIDTLLRNFPSANP